MFGGCNTHHGAIEHEVIIGRPFGHTRSQAIHGTQQVTATKPRNPQHLHQDARRNVMELSLL
ncbi:MAG: hypothetical protein ACKPKO_64295, partial [Candidatus Fonsibacter sp.]